MNVLVGWSGEVTSGVWRKFDVCLDETDLHRILVDWGLDVEPLKMKQSLVFQVLNNEAETFVCAKLSTYGVPGVSEKLTELANSKQNLKEKIRNG